MLEELNSRLNWYLAVADEDHEKSEAAWHDVMDELREVMIRAEGRS